MIRFYLVLLLFLSFYLVHSQEISKKILNIERTAESPKIDGIIDEEIWQNADIASGFVQFQPEMGPTLPENERTEVKMTFDDEAIYIVAYGQHAIYSSA